MSDIPIDSTSDTSIPDDAISEKFVRSNVIWIESRDFSEIYQSSNRSQFLTSIGTGFMTSERMFTINSYEIPALWFGILLTLCGLLIWNFLVRQKKNELIARAIPGQSHVYDSELNTTDSGSSKKLNSGKDYLSESSNISDDTY